MNYLSKKLDVNQYYILCMDYNSILNYLDEIENEDFVKCCEGDLIVDQLLVAGNGKNRFLSCGFSQGKLLMETAKNIVGTKEYRQLASKLLKQHIDLLQYSILSDHQLEAIREGQIL